MSESTQLTIQQPTRLAPLQPSSFEDIEKFAVVMAQSDLVPKDYVGKPANVCVAILMGRELGVPPMQALQGIAVINGRPSVWGDLMWALVTSHAEFEDAIESVTDEKASCTLKRSGRSPVTEEFSKQDASKAGLWDKAGPWKQYPKRMMLWRARTFAARNLFADALKGIQIREEVMDYIEGEIAPSSPKVVAFAHPEAGTKKEKPQDETKPVQDETNQAPEETKTAQAEPNPSAPQKISTEQGAEFRAAYKKAGLKTDAVGDFIKTLGAARLGDIPADKFAEAMEWVAKQTAPVSEPKPEQKTEPESGDHAFCLKAWDALGTNQDDRQADVEEYTLKTTGVVDWEALATALHARREERGV